MARNKLGQRLLVSQDDFYTEATEFEEQAERWLLSDIKKTIRFYVQALSLYEKALTAPGATSRQSYNVLYNETRLFLLIYTDYLANNGYINLLQYVRLDDVPGVSKLILPLTKIVEKFEQVYASFPNERTWDLDTNLLTCYLSLIESSDTYKLTGEDIVGLTTKFIDLSQKSLEFQFSELRAWKVFVPEEEDYKSGDATVSPSGDGSGVVAHADKAQGTESMEVTDQVTVEVLCETITGGFSFIRNVMEIIIENRVSAPHLASLNVVQQNYLQDLLEKFAAQLRDIYATASDALNLDGREIDIALEANRGVEHVANGDLNSLQIYANDALTSPEASIELILAKIDVLNFAVSCSENTESLSETWFVCTLLSKLLLEASRRITRVKNDQTALAGRQKSHLVFQLCDVLVSSSDNELRRWVIKSQDAESNHKTMEILMKNAKTFLLNASRTAQQPCGLEETIVDKLRRNYIYGQAQARLSLLENNSQNIGNADISDLTTEHPFYKQF